ncbi:hypothetical protein Tco_0883680, partial [Tanacetum coccineum]
GGCEGDDDDGAVGGGSEMVTRWQPWWCWLWREGSGDDEVEWIYGGVAAVGRGGVAGILPEVAGAAPENLRSMCVLW